MSPDSRPVVMKIAWLCSSSFLSLGISVVVIGEISGELSVGR